MVYNRWTEAAFDDAVKAGNDEIVNFFLHNFHGVIDETRKVEYFVCILIITRFTTARTMS